MFRLAPPQVVEVMTAAAPNEQALGGAEAVERALGDSEQRT